MLRNRYLIDGDNIPHPQPLLRSYGQAVPFTGTTGLVVLNTKDCLVTSQNLTHRISYLEEPAVMIDKIQYLLKGKYTPTYFILQIPRSQPRVRDGWTYRSHLASYRYWLSVFVDR